MTVFVDTSAFYAILDHNDGNHPSALRRIESLKNDQASLVTSNYVVVETSALLQNRLGLESVRDFHVAALQAVEILWVTEKIHNSATAIWFAAGRRKLSLVDCTSFEIMREADVTVALAFDRHFVEEGFTLC